ncbi:MAG: ATP-binding protein [Ignavibacterium sp.]|nr:ATP-binding protein [Ignavibacterium sp.]MCX7610585.1 ATP-binding protein [Ignavibacterium sp.]MDW8374167.1 ATP-binding protein [Ignavibacteriales bacterium]
MRVSTLKDEIITSIQRSILNQDNLGIIRIDKEGNPIYVNNHLLKLLSFQNSEEFFNHYSRNKEFQKNTEPSKYLSYLKNEIRPNFLESRWINKNGKVVFFKEFVSPVINKNGEITYFDCIIEDITNDKLVEELIKDNQLRDLSILKVLPDLLFIISYEGIFLDYKYSARNQVKFISKPGDVIGKRVEQVFPSEVADLILNAVRKTITNGELQTVEFSIERSGKFSYFEARIIHNNTYNQALILLRDITAQKQAQEELKKVTKDLEEANREKDKFFSLIAHDLRTPLIGLAGYAEILANDIDELSKEEIRNYSNNIVEISKQAIKFLSNLLEWSRLQTGRIQYNPSDVSIYLLVQSIFQLLKSNAERKNITLNNFVNPEHIVYADENMIYSVLNNLISNAIKFTNSGGEITVASQLVEDKIVTSVKDNGIGMTEEQITNLFTLNKSFTSLGTAKEKGTGLGIILCKDFISKNFGKLWVESKEGEGTTFYFSLPKYNN